MGVNWGIKYERRESYHDDGEYGKSWSLGEHGEML